MSTLHVYKIGERLQELITELVETVGEEYLADLPDSSDAVARTSILPNVELRKRRAKTGGMRIGEGITIIPLKPIQAGGTNERDDTGYRFAIAIVSGTWTSSIYEVWPVAIYEQAIRNQFNQRRIGLDLGTGGCEIGTTVAPGALPEEDMLQDDFDGSVLMITVFVRESRRNEL